MPNLQTVPLLQAMRRNEKATPLAMAEMKALEEQAPASFVVQSRLIRHLRVSQKFDSLRSSNHSFSQNVT
ncbi:MAG: hypothetical protein CMQ10_02655 [Gammaproteobacteria bacterium]|nr:hypothetical protein [Gammaproteobacteria bacterium]